MQNKIETFQGLRGWAILLIFFSHCNYLYNVDGVNKLSAFGGAGVSVFIILSGFLLAKKYLASSFKTANALVLYKKRWKQFWLLHFLTLLISLPLTIPLLHRDFVKYILHFIANATLIQTLFPSSNVYFSFNAVSWFLSLVMVFALLSPIAISIWRKLNIHKAIYIVLAVNLFEFALCYAVDGMRREHWWVYINPLIRFLDFIAGGCLFYLTDTLVLSKKNKRLWHLLINILFVIFISLLIFSIYRSSEYFSTAVWTLPSSGVMLLLYWSYEESTSCDSSSILNSVFTNAFIKWFGNISFEFFMIHQLMIRYFSAIVNYNYIKGDVNESIYMIAYACAFVSSCCFAVGYRKILNMFQNKHLKI